MKKKIGFSIVTLIVLLIMTGCSSYGSSNTARCHAIDCIKQISADNSVEDINRIIGVDGELVDEENNVYAWTIKEDELVKVTMKDDAYRVSLDIDRNTLADAKVDFSNYSELQTKIVEGISYEDFITYIGNVEGTVTEKTKLSTKYTWVSTDGNYLSATFSNVSNKCTFASGKIN